MTLHGRVPSTLSPATLLRLDPRDRRGLEWLRSRARFWLTALKRRRKHQPAGEPFSPAEAAAIQALADLERAAGMLLQEGQPQWQGACFAEETSCSLGGKAE